MGEFSGKIVLITGASKGIGNAIARKFIDQGAKVIAIARSKRKLEELDDYAKSKGSEVTLVPLDLNQADLIPQLAKSIYEKFGKLDILIGNAASLGKFMPLSHYREQDFANVMHLNLTMNFVLLKHFEALLLRSNAPRAIFVTSNMARSLPAYTLPYTVSKVGLEALVKIYAAEKASSNFKINLVDPGVVVTDMLKAGWPGLETASLTKPDDVTDIFLQLASEKCHDNGNIFYASKEKLDA